MTERIAAVAIRHPNGTVYSVPPPGRHHSVFAVMGEAFNPRSEERCVQGFVTDTGRFVGRMEAHVIAKAAGQIIRRCGGDSDTLYSENLW